MRSESIAALVDAMTSGGGSRAETFFIAHGLGAAYNSVGKNYGIQKHVNAALLQAEREGRQESVVLAGLASYGLDEDAHQGSEDRVSMARTGTQGPTSRLFISHASADKKLADALADLLRLGSDLPSDRIVCTSLEGMGVPTGNMNYLEFLRSQISDAGLVLPLFTPAFFDSEVCLIEIGAMWGLEQSTFPLIVPPINFARVEGLLGKVQAARIDEEQGLSDLRDRLLDTFGLKSKTSMWNSKRTQFEEKLPDLLSGLAQGTRVPSADLKKARRQAARRQVRVRQLEEQLSAMKDRLDEVVAAKTKEMLEEATRSRGTTIEQFEAAARAAAEALNQFSAGVREAFYEELGQGELFHPDGFGSHREDADIALRNDLLNFDEDNGGYYLNLDDPVVEETVDAVNALFDRTWGEEVKAWFRRENQKRLLIKVRATWVALGLL